MNEQTPRTIINVKELAERAGVSGQYIRRLLADGKIPGAFKVGEVWIIPRLTAEQWLDRRKDD
jgi:excisionase family DNA binding protein